MYINIWDVCEFNELYIIDDFLICIWFIWLFLFLKKKRDRKYIMIYVKLLKYKYLVCYNKLINK